MLDAILQNPAWLVQSEQGRLFVYEQTLGFLLVPGVGDAWLDTYFDQLEELAAVDFPPGTMT